MRRTVLMGLCLVGAAGCQGGLDLPEENVCFGDHIKPLVARDCSACHENGEWGIKLDGSDRDWVRIREWVSPGSPEGSMFLWYAFGFDKHPIIWTTDSAEYRTFAAWVKEGAPFGCGSVEMDLAFDLGLDSSQPDQNVLPDVAEDLGNSDSSLPPDVIADVAADIHDAVQDVAPDLPPDLPPDIPDIVEVDEVTEVPLVSFANDISPLHKASCKSCHGGGGHGVKIVGDSSDYSRVMQYVDPANPDVTAWQWASGYGKHSNLPKWGKTGSSYLLFLQWVKEGAQNN